MTTPSRSLVRTKFESGLSFAPDRFQTEAMDALDGGGSVLVSAPTGAGKTLVAGYAVQRALSAGGKAFYTTPLKALSNQKFAELVGDHGSRLVGLLTGDSSIRADAPIVVMTTEVLRNMLLAGSDLLTTLHTVVLDEVHYLQDPYRGGVWEEVLVLSPPGVVFACLSATVGNAAELGGWLASVRGPTHVVVERRRPVTLRHHMAIADVRSTRDADITFLPLLDGMRPSASGLRVDQIARRALRRGPGSRSWRNGHKEAPSLPFRTPRRSELLVALHDADRLPAIVFIFSRAACDDAVRQCRRDGLRFNDRAQRTVIRRIAEEHVSALDDDDLVVLGYPEWLEGLEAGIASHHAGLVPAFRETVEACFAAGLLQVVFATETLSLGINMPARSVVIERFSKYGSAGRAMLSSGEYTQLTGRAGRRGLDPEGHAVVLWTPEMSVADVARVATAPPPELRSAFRPTYNLAVNLIHRFDRATAIALLRRSFAQWQYAARDGVRQQGATSAEPSDVALLGPPPASGARPSHDFLVDQLARRLAVLEELHYVRGWALTDAGVRLSRVYHDADLLVAEILDGDLLAGAEPSVIAGVLSALVFEPRRARKRFGHARRTSPGATPGARRKTNASASSRLGAARRADLDERIAAIEKRSAVLRELETVHRVPPLRRPEGGLAGAVTSWARGAPLRVVLDVAALDVGEVAPGDFVRIAKQVADLADQVAQASTDTAIAAAAAQSARMVLRDVVAAGAPGAGALGS
ncbi:MAG: DEAD/DEAH box helicase [Actinomycetota bacterium]|nr:DEAD/DEAH box helicase [Actinomycetota bacterium]